MVNADGSFSIADFRKNSQMQRMTQITPSDGQVLIQVSDEIHISTDGVNHNVHDAILH